MGKIVFEDADGSPVTWTGADDRLGYDERTGHWMLATGDGEDVLHRLIPRERVCHVEVRDPTTVTVGANRS